MPDGPHPCDDCDFVAKTAGGLTSHRRAKHPPQRDGPVLEATDQAIAAADHLTVADRGTVAVLRDLARTIDGMGDRDAEAPIDNVTIPTYLKYADALALTPLSRLKLGKKEDRSGSTLGQLRDSPQLRAIRGGKAGRTA